MKNVVVISASVIRSLKPRLFDSVSYDFFKTVKDKYEFEVAPTPSQVPPATGGIAPTLYQFGKLETRNHDITIEQLNMSYIDARATSIGVLTKTSTDDGVLVLDDLFRLMQHKRFKLNTTEQIPSFFHSQLEVVFDIPLDRGFPILKGLSDRITKRLAEYKIQSNEYALSSVALHLDVAGHAPPIPTPFALERRVGAKFAENKFFSQAPLKTKDHIEALEEFERALEQ